jgi:uncharacterized protein (TIGR02246 family)
VSKTVRLARHTVTEDAVVNRPSLTLWFVACTCFAFVPVGCSSRPTDVGLVPRPQPVLAGLDAGARRPIPEVIPKSRRFTTATLEAARRTRPGARPGPRPGAVIPAGWERPLTAAPAQPCSAPAPADDIAGIGRLMRSYLESFNRHDSMALAGHWSDTGENIDLDSGTTTSGREAVHDVFAALFTQESDATIDIDVQSIRPVRDDVAVVDGVSRIAFADGTPSGSRFSAVVVRQAGVWMIDSVRESKLPAAADGAPRPAPGPLHELAWLVGSWEDVGEGVTASTRCFWSTNGAFLIRNHMVTIDAAQEQRPLPGDGRIPGLLASGPTGSREITEIIGFDPDRRAIRSWIFTSEGRFAEASWSRQGHAWTVRIDGAAGDCSFTLTRVGPDELSCRSTCDAATDLLPPPCDFLRTARAAGSP